MTSAAKKTRPPTGYPTGDVDERETGQVKEGDGQEQGRYHDNSYDDQYNYSPPPKPQYVPSYGHGCNPAPYGRGRPAYPPMLGDESDQEEIEVEVYEDNYGHRPMKPVYNGHEGQEGYYRRQAHYVAESYEVPAPPRRRPPPTCNNESIYRREDRYNGRY
eukprot:Gb_35473 [translate_table: standard]